MMEHLGTFGVELLEWLATYAVHSTLLLGIAALATRRFASDEWRETAWKAALVGGVLTASIAALRAPALEWTLPGITSAADPVVAPLTPASVSDDFAPAGSAPDPAHSDASGLAIAASGPESVEGGGETSSTAGFSESGAGAPSQPLVAWLLLGWLAVAAILLARLAHRHVRVRRLLVGRRIVREPGVLRLLAELQRGAGVWRRVRLTASADCPSPLALGGGEICLPERLLSELDGDQQRSALAHELAHLARRDPQWQLGAAVLGCVFFFQPLNTLARRRMREAAEHLCDDWAVRQTGSPLALARCLAHVAAWVGAADAVPSGTVAMAEGGSPLLRRVERLLTKPRAPERDRHVMRAVAALGLLALVAWVAPAVSAAPDTSAATHRGGAPPPPAPEPANASQPAAEEAAPGAEAAEPPRVRAPQEEVIAHPSPGLPLEDKWAWVPGEAARRDHEDYWVAYAFERVLPAGRRLVEDSHGWHTDEWRDPPLGRLLLGPSYEAPAKGAGPVRQPLIVLLRVRAAGPGAGTIRRVAVRSASLGMDLRGEPLYWLGTVPQEQSLEWLIERVDDLREPRLQGTAVEAVSLHEDSERVVPFLQTVIRSRKPEGVREEAVEGLEWHPTEQAVGLLLSVALSQSESGALREEAAEALGEIPSPAADGALRRVVRSEAPVKVREEAVEAMAERGSEGLIQELIRIAMEDPSPHLQEEAVEALAKVGGSAAVPELARIARTHPSPRTQEEAVEALADVDSEAAADLLESLLRDGALPEKVREEALEALADRRTPRALEAVFRAAMSDPSSGLQLEAVEELTAFPAQDAAPLLERIIFEHQASPVRRQAVDELERLPREVRVPLLDRIFERSTDAAVLDEALDVLEDLPEEIAGPRLRRLAEGHPRADVRRGARERIEDRGSKHRQKN